MTNEIKQRIEQINNGIVPERYRKTKAGIMPLDWLADGEVKAKQVFTSVSYKNNSFDLEVLSATQEQGVIPRSMVNIDIKFDEENTSGYKRVDKGDFVISLRSFQGGIEYSEYNGVVSPAYTVLKPIIDISDGFYRYYFKSADYITRLNQGTYGIRDGKQIGYKDFGEMIIHYPPIAEQEKIAEILATQDNKISLLQELIDQKLLTKKYIVKLLMSGQARLKGFDDKWLEYKLEDILTERKEHAQKGDFPHVTLSVDGIYDKGERYDREHLVKDEAKEYKITKLNDICYNPANLKFGVICKNNYGTAIFSPIYVTFEVSNNVDIDFISNYLTQKDFINKVRKYEEGTVYERMAVKPSDFLKFKLLLPTIEEQNAISKVLNSMDKEIDLLNQDLEQEKFKKKALMQLLLTGIVRVDCD